jgi:hypothetical protein
MRGILGRFRGAVGVVCGRGWPVEHLGGRRWGRAPLGLVREKRELTSRHQSVAVTRRRSRDWQLGKTDWSW